MTGFLGRLAAYLHGEAPTVALRPRGPFEPDPGPGPDPWPATGLAEQHDADHEPVRHAASVPPSGSVPGPADRGPADTGPANAGPAGTDPANTDLAGTGPAGRGPDGFHAAKAHGPGPDDSHPGTADGPAPASPRPDARSRTAGPAGRRPPDGPARPAAMPEHPLPPDEGPAWPWSGLAHPADSRARQVPVPAPGTAAASTPLALDGTAWVDPRSEDGARAPASGAAGPGGADRAAPTVVHKNFGSTAPGDGPAQPAPPSLDELLARHVVPALRAAGAARSGRDTVRLTQEPVTEHRGGDVHVHLGRIEVVQPPAAAPGGAARSRPRPPAPDHEAYLARRREGRR